MRTKVYKIVMRSKDPEKIIDIFKPAFECYGDVERIIIEDTGRPDIDIFWIFRTTRKNFKTINRIWNNNGWAFKKIKDIFSARKTMPIIERLIMAVRINLRPVVEREL